jgi:hypothetical protein
LTVIYFCLAQQAPLEYPSVCNTKSISTIIQCISNGEEPSFLPAAKKKKNICPIRPSTPCQLILESWPWYHPIYSLNSHAKIQPRTRPIVKSSTKIATAHAQNHSYNMRLHKFHGGTTRSISSYTSSMIIALNRSYPSPCRTPESPRPQSPRPWPCSPGPRASA